VIDRSIARLSALFVALFAIAGCRLWYVQVIAGPRIAASAYNSRNGARAARRGEILARDGTILAGSNARGRTYPQGPELAHVVGYASARYGTTGLEDAADAWLRPPIPAPNAAEELRAVLSGRPAPVPRGAAVVTTIDPAIEDELWSVLREHRRAAGVVLDVRSGEVLALGSVPSFDPARIDAIFPALLRDTAANPLIDRSLNGLYPPGSTFKIFTAAAALEAGVTAPDATFYDPGYLEVGGTRIHDDESEATYTQTLTGAFARSSNVDFGRLALALGVDGWFAYARRWRLDRATPFDLPVTKNRLPLRAEASPGVLAQLGFGQADLLVTPMQMALIAATIARGGEEPRPYLVRAVRRNGVDERVGRPATLATPVSARTAAVVRDLMVAVVRRGTGMAAALPEATVAGKTGTATTDAGRAHAWFVAFAPAEAPRVAVAIIVEHAGYGGTVAAPMARRVLRTALARVRV